MSGGKIFSHHYFEYAETGQDDYEQQYRDRLITNLARRAKTLGFELVESAT